MIGSAMQKIFTFSRNAWAISGKVDLKTSQLKNVLPGTRPSPAR